MAGALSCPERADSPIVKHIHIAEQRCFISAPDQRRGNVVSRHLVNSIIRGVERGRHEFHEFVLGEVPFDWVEAEQFFPCARDAKTHMIGAFPNVWGD